MTVTPEISMSIRMILKPCSLRGQDVWLASEVCDMASLSRSYLSKAIRNNSSWAGFKEPDTHKTIVGGELAEYKRSRILNGMSRIKGRRALVITEEGMWLILQNMSGPAADSLKKYLAANVLPNISNQDREPSIPERAIVEADEDDIRPSESASRRSPASVVKELLHLLIDNREDPMLCRLALKWACLETGWTPDQLVGVEMPNPAPVALPPARVASDKPPTGGSPKSRAAFDHPGKKKAWYTASDIAAHAKVSNQVVGKIANTLDLSNEGLVRYVDAVAGNGYKYSQRQFSQTAARTVYNAVLASKKPRKSRGSQLSLVG